MDLGFAKSQNSCLVWQAHGIIEADEAPVQGALVQLFFHGWIAEVQLELQAVETQHGLNGKRWSTSQGMMRAARKRLNERNQSSPGDQLVHLAQEDFFAGLLMQWVKAERDLIYYCYLALPSGQAVVSVARVLQSFPREALHNPANRWVLIHVVS